MAIMVKCRPIISQDRTADDKNHIEKSKYGISIHLLFDLKRITTPEIKTRVNNPMRINITFWIDE